MWFKSESKPEGTGTIEDIIVRAKQKFDDVENQAKYIKAAINLLKSNFGDEVGVFNFVLSNYDGVITMFPSGGEIFAHWELYENGALEASGMEKYNPNTEEFQILFTTSTEFNKPLLPLLMSKR